MFTTNELRVAPWRLSSFQISVTDSIVLFISPLFTVILCAPAIAVLVFASLSTTNVAVFTSAITYMPAGDSSLAMASMFPETSFEKSDF